VGFDAAIALLVCVALAAGLGVLAQRILGLKVGGFVGTVFLGTVGAYLGKEAAHGFGLPEVAHLSIRGRSFPLLWSIIGALAATLIVAAYSSRGRKAKRK
jgi:uncharacterized membrane protein YeaQ/YmgE (transglycosylase-associated protein family)